MQTPCHFLEWDSNFFDRRIGQLDSGTLEKHQLDAALTWCDKMQVECLYFLSSPYSPETTRLVEVSGFTLVDVRTEYTLPTSRASRPGSSGTVRPATESDIIPAAAIAEHVHHGGRFHNDEHLKTKADVFYAVWITNSIRGFADQVFVSEANEATVGYVTCKLNGDGSGQIGLIGVSPDYQGMGLGRQLLNEAVHWFSNQGCSEVRVVTQASNIGAQVLYQRSGFTTKSAGYWFHWWRRS